MYSRACCWQLVALCSLPTAACTGDTSHPSRQVRAAVPPTRLPDCPHPVASNTAWSQVSTPDGRFTLRLPVGYALMGGTDNMWRIQGGSVSYSSAPRAQAWIDSLLTDTTAAHRGWCHEQIAGMPSLVKYAYSDHAFAGAGYYLQVVGQIDDASDVRLIGMMRDTTRAAVLLEIARSLKPSATPGAR